MALTIEQIFDAIASVYASDPDKATFITIATSRTNSCRFGTNYNQAVALRAAHMMALRPTEGARGGGASGSLSSKKEGDLAVSFGSSSKSSYKNDDLSQTSYGVQLLGLMQGSGGFIGVTGGNDNGCNSAFTTSGEIV